MENRAEGRYLMDELIKRLKTKRAVAIKLGQSEQAFNKSYHYAKRFSLEQILNMKLLLNQLIEEEAQTVPVATPLTDITRLKLELLALDKKNILTHFKSVQSLLLPTYATATAFNPPLKMIHTAVYYDAPLLEAEKNTCLPLRTTFIGLLACCDSKGYFYWEPENLKAAIFPYIPIYFTPLLEALCTYSFVEKKQIANKLLGYIPLKNTFVYEGQSKRKVKNHKH